MPTVTILPDNRALNDQALIHEIANGNIAAFDYLYDHYSAALYGVLLRIVRSEEVADELLSDLFLSIRDSIGSYESKKGRLFIWMIALARKMAFDKLSSVELIFPRAAVKPTKPLTI